AARARATAAAPARLAVATAGRHRAGPATRVGAARLPGLGPTARQPALRPAPDPPPGRLDPHRPGLPPRGRPGRRRPGRPAGGPGRVLRLAAAGGRPGPAGGPGPPRPRRRAPPP